VNKGKGKIELSDLARLKYHITPAYVTDTVTKRSPRWVKIIEGLNSENLLEDNGK